MMTRFEKVAHKSEFDAKAHRTLQEVSLFYPAWKSDLKALRTVEVFFADIASEFKNGKIEESARKILGDLLHTVYARHNFYPNEDSLHWWGIEKRFKKGVTDNTANAFKEILELALGEKTEAHSGSVLWLGFGSQKTKKEIEDYAIKVFANDLIENVQCFSLSEYKASEQKRLNAKEEVSGKMQEGSCEVEVFDFADADLNVLAKISNERLWAFSVDELKTIQDHCKKERKKLTDVEIEVIAQTWSEHCKHKIFAANISVVNERADVNLPAHVNSVFKTFIKGATDLCKKDYLRSVFEDNAGIIQMNETTLCAIKVETHNSPSALDPYGGALTGIVGVNRDILGAGLGAKPIANLDVFCVGPLDAPEPLPPRLHHPRRILEGIRTGVEHGGNKSGIPTVTGAVAHHEGFLGKPLVFCGTIGILPVGNSPANGRDFTYKEIFPGDKIVMTGGRIGKDGIHGATFSSMEMNEDSPVTAVQLGDPLMQRRVWDFLIEARDRGLFRAVTDNGAGGLSSSIGELARMSGKKGGARMDVSLAPTKYPGLKPYEYVVSESQERMSFAVAPEDLDEFLALSKKRNVESTVLGEFTDSGFFEIQFAGKTVGSLDMEFLHKGLPQMNLKAVVKNPKKRKKSAYHKSANLKQALLETLAHANICSRAEIVRQYDHEVQARTVRKPYGSPNGLAPNDGATLRLSREARDGVALGLGLAPQIAEFDAKVAAELAVDEAIRNALVAGMDPSHAVLVDNFCWPDPLPGPHNPDAEEKLGALVVSSQRLYEASVILEMPFVSGKDSMKNDYRMNDLKISVPPTVLITAMGKVHDTLKVPFGFLPQEKTSIFWVSGQTLEKGILKWDENHYPILDFKRLKSFYSAFHSLVREGILLAAHDVSEGGWMVAQAEMGMGADQKVILKLPFLSDEEFVDEPGAAFVLAVKPQHEALVQERFKEYFCVKAGHSQQGDASLSIELSNGAFSWTNKEMERAYVKREC